MKLSTVVTIMVVLANLCYGQDVDCSTGLLDSKGDICCLAACEICTGVGCGHPGNPYLNGTECCESEIMESEKSCRYYDPPCIMEVAGEDVVIKHHDRPNCRGRFVRTVYDIGSCFYTRNNAYTIVDAMMSNDYHINHHGVNHGPNHNNVLVVAEGCLNPSDENLELRLHKCYNFDNESLRVMHIRNN